MQEEKEDKNKDLCKNKEKIERKKTRRGRIRIRRERTSNQVDVKKKFQGYQRKIIGKYE